MLNLPPSLCLDSKQYKPIVEIKITYSQFAEGWFWTVGKATSKIYYKSATDAEQDLITFLKNL